MTAPHFTPFDHQIEAQSLMKNIETKESCGGILADECGLGKTITMAMYMKENKLVGLPDLIVCPMSVMNIWEKEIKRIYKASSSISPKILVYHGLKRKDNFHLIGTYDYVITSYTILSSDTLERVKWGRVVLDESHIIKNGLSSNQPKCAKAAYNIVKSSVYRWCISATPFNNRITDLASQARFICTSPYNDPVWWKSNAHDKKSTDDWYKKYVIRRTKEDMLEKPEYENIEIDPTPVELEYVNSLRKKAGKHFELWMRSSAQDKSQLQIRILALIQKLRVYSDSFYCGKIKKLFEIDEKDKISLEDGEPDSELDEIMDNCSKVKTIVNDLDIFFRKDPRKGVVIFSQFTSFLDILERCIEYVIPELEVLKFTGDMNNEDRDNVIQYFNTSKRPRVILVSLLAGGVGLSLHKGSSTVMLCESHYNPFIEIQAEERVHRLGQKHKVHIYRYYMKNSVETWIGGLKAKKMSIASGLYLGKKGEITQEFDFDDLKTLFSDFVNFKSDKKIEVSEEEKGVTASSTSTPNVVKKATQKEISRGPIPIRF